KAGADIYNIIPLIPQHRFANLSEPTCETIDAARQAAEQFTPVFRHCQHCRADAVGMIGGTDFRKEIYGSAAPETFSHG
ncbi:MAG: nitrogen fixation protein NifB, partial [Clostridiales Family XIII bacterium]|nr:nitrogen fixation protein NifB [Clostridiales Family XIII bacterium]